MAYIFSIEGNIAAGKTTLLKKLKETSNLKGYPILFIEEPVEVWETIKDSEGKNILQHFYDDNVKYAFPFQMMAYISKIQLLVKTIKDNEKSIIILDRSIFTDKNIFVEMLHDSGKLNDIEYNIYLKWFDAYKEGVKLDGIIYLKADVENSMERIITRGRPGEKNIPKEYLQSCYNYHEKWLNNLEEQENILLLNGNRDLNDDYENHILAVHAFMQNFIDDDDKNHIDEIMKIIMDHPFM